MTDKELCALAEKAANNSYSPYSGFRVGAALLCADGSVFLGCNVENSSYSATNCAERVAIQKAVSEGKRNFVAIAVAGGKSRVGETPCYPCGICRQVMAEFCDKDSFRIILPQNNEYRTYLLSELLPMSFTEENLR